MAIPQSLAAHRYISIFFLQQSFLINISLAVRVNIERVVGKVENTLFKVFPSYGTTLSFTFQVHSLHSSEDTVLCTAFLRPPRWKMEADQIPSPSARVKAAGYFYRHAVRGGVVFSRACVGRRGFASSSPPFRYLALLTFVFTRNSSTTLLVVSTHAGCSRSRSLLTLLSCSSLKRWSSSGQAPRASFHSTVSPR